MKLSSTVVSLAIVVAKQSANAFVIPTGTPRLASTVATSSIVSSSSSSSTLVFSTPSPAEETTESVFLPLEMNIDDNDEGDDDDDDDNDEGVNLDTIEGLGRGAAKAKRGKRKSGSGSSDKKTKASVTLAPEEIFYEGPPAITETIVPTLSILTIIGIIPAAASWARQAWVRYKITTRRIRVTSGINGQDMAEIVYPDVVDIRTVKRLFGDGDMVLFLRDGAKFEMRNIPDFDNAVEFILTQCDPEVVQAYRKSGDVTKS